jgi:hypothetical protein
LRQHDGAQQQRLHAWGEDRVARLDGVFAIAQLVGAMPMSALGALCRPRCYADQRLETAPEAAIAAMGPA